jgi:hypothetical protein
LTEARYRFWTNSFTPKEFDALVVSRPELQPDPARGSLTVSVLDCDGFSGQGVEVTLDPDPGIKPV